MSKARYKPHQPYNRESYLATLSQVSSLVFGIESANKGKATKITALAGEEIMGALNAELSAQGAMRLALYQPYTFLDLWASQNPKQAESILSKLLAGELNFDVEIDDE